jgi:hypothetical protein
MTDVSEAIVQELRAQIDHQIGAADAFDTKGAVLAAATFALFTFALPHVEITTNVQTAAAAIALVATLGAFYSFVSSLQPRSKAFSYGVDATQLIAAEGMAKAAFMHEYAGGLQLARDRNESAIRARGQSITNGLWSLFAACVALAILLGAGGINAGA